MKILFTASVLLFAPLTQAQVFNAQVSAPGNRVQAFETLALSNGATFSKAEVRSFTPASLRIAHAHGYESVLLQYCPEQIQKLYHYDASRAIVYSTSPGFAESEAAAVASLQAAGPVGKLTSIPDMMPVDLYLNCEKKGFTVSKEYADKKGDLNAWTCIQKDGTRITMAAAYSKDTVSVETITGLIGPVTESDLKKGGYASAFLGWLSSSVYTGNLTKQTKVRSWVEDNLPAGGEMMMDGMFFNVFVKEGGAQLRISVLPMPK